MLGQGGGAGLATVAKGVPQCAPHLHQTSFVWGCRAHSELILHSQTPNHQQGEVNALEKFRRLSWGQDYQGNI